MNNKSIVLKDGLRYHEGDVLICKMNMKLKEVQVSGRPGGNPHVVAIIFITFKYAHAVGLSQRTVNMPMQWEKS